jgi:hypothetical protein
MAKPLVALPRKSEHVKGEEGKIPSSKMEGFAERKIVVQAIFFSGRNNGWVGRAVERINRVDLCLPPHQKFTRSRYLQ